MRSSPAPGESASRSTPADDRTSRARIRDAALTRFGTDGVDGTSVRAIAADAGVSPALVIHHFGSKDALRVACDQHVAAVIRAHKQEAMSAGPSFDPLAALSARRDGPPVLRYLARTLGDTSPHVADLVDDLVDDAIGYLAQGVASGALRPTDRPRARAVVLMVWSLGALVLHEHLDRLLGVDLTSDTFDAGGMSAYSAAALEILTEGVVAPEMAAALRSTATGGRS